MTLIVPRHILLCFVLKDTAPGKNHINQWHKKCSAITIIWIDFFSHEFVDYFSDFPRYSFGCPLSILLFPPFPFLLLLFSYLSSLLFSFLSSLLSLPFSYHSPILFFFSSLFSPSFVCPLFRHVYSFSLTSRPHSSPLTTFLSFIPYSLPAASTESGLLMGRVVGVIRRNWRQYAGSLDLGGSGDKEEG